MQPSIFKSHANEKCVWRVMVNNTLFYAAWNEDHQPANKTENRAMLVDKPTDLLVKHPELSRYAHTLTCTKHIFDLNPQQHNRHHQQSFVSWQHEWNRHFYVDKSINVKSPLVCALLVCVCAPFEGSVKFKLHSKCVFKWNEMWKKVAEQTA